jgi:hypothetical protein
MTASTARVSGSGGPVFAFVRVLTNRNNEVTVARDQGRNNPSCR